VAERLTKQWLMGVRRGWLQVMEPNITDWPSVLKALDRLDTFAENLKEQVLYVRRGPYSSMSFNKERKQLEQAFEKLDKWIYNARDTARHWKSWADGTAGGYQWGEDRSADAAHMLDLYRKDFIAVTSGDIPQRGSYGLVKQVPLTYFMDKILGILRADAKRIIEYYKAFSPSTPAPKLDVEESVFTEFALGQVKVVIDDRTVRPDQINMYAKDFTKAQRALQKKGFGKVWYGTIFVRCEKCGGENPYGAELGVGGNYPSGPDVVNIFSRPGNGTGLLIHELGHRWWFKFMRRGVRLRFIDWVQAGLSPVSSYGSKAPEEAFAEAFAWYVMGKSMTSQQVETFKATAFGKRLASTSRRSGPAPASP